MFGLRHCQSLVSLPYFCPIINFNGLMVAMIYQMTAMIIIPLLLFFFKIFCFDTCYFNVFFFRFVKSLFNQVLINIDK